MGAKPDIVDKYNLTYIPYTDSYEKYTQVIKQRNWDIGLAPIPDTEFHSCKYFNKYVEYASFGIVGIYSNLEPYTFGIQDGLNGVLADNDTESWFNALEKLINDKKTLNKISNNCLKEARDIYSLSTLSEDYFNRITDGYNPEETREIPGMWKERISFLFHKIIDKIQEQGLLFPIWVIKYIYLKIKDIVFGKSNNV